MKAHPETKANEAGSLRRAADSLSRRRAVLSFLAAPLLPATTGAATGDPRAWPERAIRLLVGVTPGGSTDALSRQISEGLHVGLGQPVVVENRPGANTAVAAAAVARATPDGYTLLTATDALITVPQLVRTTFDPFKDFVPITTVAGNPLMMVVHPSLPVSTVAELIAYAKAHPGKLSFSTSGSGGTSHLAIEKFKMTSGTHMVHVPYRGAAAAITDNISGLVQMSMWTPLAALPHITAGRLKPLAVTGTRRVQVLPNVPTFAEAGMPAFDHKVWLGLFAPAGTPRAIVAQLNTELGKWLALPKTKESFALQAVESLHSTPEQTAAFMRSQAAEIARLVKFANVKMD